MISRINNHQRYINHEDYINHYILGKKKEKDKYCYQPTNRALTIMACHVSDMVRLQTIKQNIQYLNFKNNHIIVVTTANLPLNTKLKHFCNINKIQYLETVNDKWLDFGKWLYVLENTDYTDYESIYFTNDSFIIKSSIFHFFNLAFEKKTEIYAYTSSSEIKYHYQSYLFSINKDVISKFIHFIREKIYLKTQTQFDAVHIELNLLHNFTSKDCFLDLGKNESNIKQNIFFTNNQFYYPLFNSQLLPFVKLKRTTTVTNKNGSNKLINSSFYKW